jgi:uncharacterized protein YukE
MPQAIVDPDQLRQFAGLLRGFTEDMQQRSSVIQAQLSTLSQSWRDQQHHKFAAEFEEQLRQMGRLVEASREYVPFLLRKADQIDAYLRG